MKINSFIIYIVIAIATSIYGQYKKKQKEDKKTSNPYAAPNTESIDDTGQSVNPLQNMMNDVMEKYFEDKKEVANNISDSLKEIESKEVITKDMRKNQRSPQRSRLRRNNSSSLVSVVERKKEQDIYDIKTVKGSIQPDINRDTLIQGIIMAEILQPPRARRPYRPIYLQDK